MIFRKSRWMAGLQVFNCSGRPFLRCWRSFFKWLRAGELGQILYSAMYFRVTKSMAFSVSGSIGPPKIVEIAANPSGDRLLLVGALDEFR